MWAERVSATPACENDRVTKLSDPLWKQFELAVAEFVSALDPSANVQHDVKLPDRDTGEPRQRDVWVEAKLLGHFSVNVLISCKRTRRKLDQQDIDAFAGELSSSGAHFGVIYSDSGFTKPAVAKARARGFSCCRLYAGEAPDIPDALVIRAYCASPKLQLAFKNRPPKYEQLRTFGDLLAAGVETNDGRVSCLHLIANAYRNVERFALDKISGSALPKAHECQLKLLGLFGQPEPLEVVIGVRWQFWRSRLEANLIDGSYNVTNGEFIGALRGPAIDLRGASPGPGWESISELPLDGSNMVLCVLNGPRELEDVILQAIGEKRIEEGTSSENY